MAAFEFGDGALEHRLADDQLADQIHHGVDAAAPRAEYFRAACEAHAEARCRIVSVVRYVRGCVVFGSMR